MIEIINNLELIDLSSDQLYLLNISKAVITGVCGEDLAKKSPGKLSHARWLTTANRILRLYISTTIPSETLYILSEFIVKVYVFGWFSIKINHNIKDGAVNLYKIIHATSYLKDPAKTIVQKSLQANGYFAHPENILLSMLFDNRENVRELALRRLLKARNNNSTQIRKYDIPKINFLCEDYIDMITWQFTDVTEPPLTKHISTEELKRLINNNINITEDIIYQYPVHTQAVERCIKEVTEASKKVCTASKRDGFIRARLEDRKIMPVFKSKKDFNAN